jgi:DNA polymerase
MDKWLKAAQRATTPAARRRFTRKHKALNIRNEMAGCENCELHKQRTQTVPFDNDRPRPIAFVGEAPGKQEDESGLPFVGRSGQLLDSIIEATGNARSDCVVLNTLACRPPHNRKPTRNELSACRPLFDKQLDFTGAWVVVLLGASALNQIRPGSSITEQQGKPFWQEGRIYIPTFHPAYVLRKPNLKKVVTKDINKAFRIANGFEWPEPQFIRPLAKPNDEDSALLTQLLDKRGWAAIDSTRLQQRVVVVTDTVVKVPAKYSTLIRYTVEELVRIGELGQGHRLTTSELNGIHLVKHLGGSVLIR